MKQKLSQSIEIPEGISCRYEERFLICKKGSAELKRKIHLPQVKIEVEGKNVSLICEKGNKKNHKEMMASLAHIANMFLGLQKEFIYKLESVSVHFPMTLKVEGEKLAINNFLGEKVPRYAKILPNVKVEIKGQSITVSSHDREAAGQTAANFEKATIVRKRDRRIYQDGIYIVEKPGRRENV